MQELQKGQAAILGLAITLGLLAGCTPAPEKPVAQAQPEFKGAVPINDIMVSIVDHNAHILWNAADPKLAPKTDQDWHGLEHAAVAIAAAGNMVMIPGPAKEDQEWVKDPDWRKYAQDVTNAGVKALNAVDRHNQKELETAGDDLVITCEACHKKYKPTLPAHVAKPMEQPEHYHRATEK